MRCEAFERRLQWLLDRRDRPEMDHEIREHASVCAPCARFLAAQSQLFQSLNEENRPQLDRTFAERVVNAADMAAPSISIGHRWMSQRSWGILAVVAALLLVICIPYWMRHASPTSRSGLTFSRSTDHPTITQQAESLVRDAAQFGPDLRRWVENLSLPPLERIEAVDHLSGGLRSIASTINGALEAIRRHLPINDRGMLEDPEKVDSHPMWMKYLT